MLSARLRLDPDGQRRPRSPLAGPQGSVAPGQSTSLEVELSAATAGRYVGTAILPTNDPDYSELAWQLAGSVAAISEIRLWNDTGVSSSDLASSDPSLAILVGGLAEAAPARPSRCSST
jgi:hypothetical protein